MANREKPKSRSWRLEILVALAVAGYLCVFLIAGTNGRVEILLEQARNPGTQGAAARHAATAGAGIMAALGIVMARALRRMGARRQLLLAALGSATLAVWQVARLGSEGGYGASGAAVAALAFAFASRGAQGPPEDIP